MCSKVLMKRVVEIIAMERCKEQCDFKKYRCFVAPLLVVRQICLFLLIDL